MHAGAADRLLAIDFAEIMDVEAQKINDFAGGVDLGLKGIFALTKHRGAVHVGAIFGRDEVGGAQENVGAVFPAQALPMLAGGEGFFYGKLDMAGITDVKMPQRVGMLMRRGHAVQLARADLLPADDHGHVDFVAFQVLELGF